MPSAMFTKKFVSLYFSSSEIRIAQLDSGGTRIKFMHTIAVPEGIISDRNVVDRDALANLLKTIWTKLKIRDKLVGIVIPEFSTFTKEVEIPKIDRSELDEAVRWQAQEFLPWQQSDTNLDWKILKETEDGYSILFVAVRKVVLDGYVDAAAQAGLFPIAVETPSLSLVRLSNSGDVGKFIFYGGKNSSIFIISIGENIVGSSVVYSDKIQSLKETSSRMAGHYSSIAIESVEVDGPGVTNELVTNLKELFGKEPVRLTKKSSIYTVQNNPYLIPLSLQHKDPSVPADEFSINLLPPKLVKKYELKKLQVQIWSLSLVISYIVWFSFFASLASYFYLDQQVQSLQNTEGLLRKTNPEKVETIKEIQTINTLVSKVAAIDAIAVSPQEILNPVYSVRPEGISISRYKVDLESGEVGLIGVSKNRQSLLTFKQSIEEIEQFSLVDVPIASLEVNQNAEFTMRFSYLPISSKAQPTKPRL